MSHDNYPRELLHALLLLCAVASILAGQTGTPTRQVRVPVWVQSQGADVKGPLRGQDVTVSVGGVKSLPAGLLGPGDDLVLLVVTDMTSDLALAKLAKRALVDAVQGLPSNALVGLLRAQDGLKVLLDPTADRALLTSTLESVPVSGKAGLLETVESAAGLGDVILSRAAVRLAVLFITDSDVGNYREDFLNPVINSSDSRDVSRRFRDAFVRERISKLETSLTARGTPVFIVHLSYRSDALNEAYQTGLLRLSAATGAAAYFCRSQTEIADTVRKAFEAVKSEYLIAVPLTADLPNTVDIKLESPGRVLNWRSRFVAQAAAVQGRPEPPAAPPAPSAQAEAVKEPVGAPVDPKVYVIGAGDILQIRVWREPDLSGPVAVRPDGRISLPLIGDLQAGGLTPEKLAEAIKEGLVKYVTEPEVMVQVASVNSKKYFISGEVQRPGSYPLVVPTTIAEALAIAGGFRDYADTRNILIMRGPKRYKFNFKDFVRAKNPVQNILLESSDHIIVP